jgi:hypothetical protein
VLAIGFLANLLIRPVPERYHEPADGGPAVPAQSKPTEPVKGARA